MNLGRDLKDRKLNNEIRLSLYDKEGNKSLDKSIIIDLNEKRITNLKVFFVELIEQSFLEEKKYDIKLKLSDYFKHECSSLIQLLEECIQTYDEAL